MNIPEGYVLVPINATSAMIEHGKDERMQCLANPSLNVQGALVRIYGAMVSAAPPVDPNDLHEEILGLLGEARKTLEMWKDVAPAISLCADIDQAIAKSRARSAE